MDDALRVDAIERRQALADFRAAADAGRHQREPVEGARRIALSERGGNMREPRMKQERLGFAKDLRDGVQEAGEERDVGFHRAGRVEQGDESERLDLAPAEFEVERFAAMRDAEPDRRAQVEPSAAPARALAAREPRPHHPRETFGQLRGLGALPIPYECRDVLPGHRLLRRRASMPPAAISRSAFGSSALADVGRFLSLIGRRRGHAGNGGASGRRAPRR